jgi:hypothetical protein
MMTLLEQMQARRAELEKQRQAMIDAAMQLQADINAYNGAIGECDHWIASLQSEAQHQAVPQE